MNFSKKGYVYILTNPSYSPNLLKIGMTTRTPEERAKELYEKHTGVPKKFIVEYKKGIANCEFAEEVIHNRLANFRTNKYREFFEIHLKEAKNIIDEVCGEVEKIYGKPPVEIDQEESHKGQYIKYKSGIVYDKTHRLEWYECPERLYYSAAKEWISSLSIGSKKWRMPNENELRSLYNPGIGPRYTPLLSSKGGWCVWFDSNSNYFRNSPHSFNFGNGSHTWELNGDKYYKVFAVRSKEI